MRIITALVLAVALAACGSKKSVKNPDNNRELQGDDERDNARPDDADEAAPMAADPCEGGE
jgi:predicted small lipoprotein YifL